ncbi:hypothetical protein POM88_040553 [Heracleum sosnowskyi]|uniref:Uncharacterized protein n=1 Tax=Heracleum sosnowskyi TaxID=360622 RepID=A0AAD8HF64_9APIA|nr:hypothetical protein POM88_040553 [Heracleum sosnowskyi]
MLTKEDTASSMVMLSKGGRKPQQTSLRMSTSGRPDTSMRSKAQIGEEENTPSLSIKPHLTLITQEDTSPAAANCSLVHTDSGPYSSLQGEITSKDQEPGPYSSLQGEITSKEQNMYDDYDWEDWSCFQDTNVTNTENKDIGDGGGDVGDSAGDVGESRNKDMPFAENNDIEDVQELPPLVPVSTDMSSSEDNFENLDNTLIHMARSRSNFELRLSAQVQCFRLLFYGILITFYSPIFICLFLYNASLSDLKCSLQSFYVPQLSGSTNNRSIYFDVKLQNKLSTIGVYYDDLNLSFHLYNQNKSGMNQVGNYIGHKFYQGSLMTTHLIHNVDTYEMPLESLSLNGSGSTNQIFRVNLQTKVRFANMWKTKRHKLTVGADVEVDIITGKEVKEEVVLLDFNRGDIQQLHLQKLIGSLLWLCLVLSLLCFPCFLIVLLTKCLCNIRKTDSRPMLSDIRSSQPQMLAQEESFSVPLINQLSVSSASGIEQPGSIALHISIDSPVMDPSTSDLEQSHHITLQNAVDSLMVDASDVEQHNNNSFHTAIGSTMVDPSTTSVEQPSNISFHSAIDSLVIDTSDVEQPNNNSFHTAPGSPLVDPSTTKVEQCKNISLHTAIEFPNLDPSQVEQPVNYSHNTSFSSTVVNPSSINVDQTKNISNKETRTQIEETS